MDSLGSNTMTQAIWLRTLLTELNFIQPLPAELLLHNQLAITLASNLQFHARSKHINIRHHFIHSCVVDGLVTLFWCPTHEMIADILMKPLPYSKFSTLSQSLGMLAPVTNRDSASLFRRLPRPLPPNSDIFTHTPTHYQNNTRCSN